MKNLHLRGHCIGYFAHMRRAVSFGIRCAFWTAEVFTHAFLPNMFTDTTAKMKQEIIRLEKDC